MVLSVTELLVISSEAIDFRTSASTMVPAIYSLDSPTLTSRHGTSLLKGGRTRQVDEKTPKPDIGPREGAFGSHCPVCRQIVKVDS